MQSDDATLQRICFACGQYLPNPVDEEHLKNCRGRSSKKSNQCKSCLCLVDINKLYRHLNHKTVKCRASFTTAEINALSKLCSESITTKEQNTKTEVQDDTILRRCEVCHIKFERLYAHVTKDKDCKAGYGIEGMNKLKKQAELERKKSKNEWKRNQAKSKKSHDIDQKCDICLQEFKNLKHHLNQTPECRNKYKAENLKAMDEKSKQKRKSYLAQYYKCHKPDEEKKKELSFDNQLKHELYNDRIVTIRINRLAAILNSKLKWQSDQLLKLKQTVTLSLIEFVNDNSESFQFLQSFLDEIEARTKCLKDEWKVAVTFLNECKETKWWSMPNTKECRKVVNFFNIYSTEVFKLGKTNLKTICEYLDDVTEVGQQISTDMSNKYRQFQESSNHLAKQYSKDFDEVKFQHDKRQSIWDLVRKIGAYKQMDVINKLKKIWVPQVEKNFETFSMWIPSYKVKIEEYKKQENCTKNGKETLSYLVNRINTNYNELKEDIKSFIARLDTIKVNWTCEQLHVAPTFNALDDIVFNSKMLMEKCEDLLRFELFYTNKDLQDFGHVPSYTNEETNLKFGVHPDCDYVGAGEEKILKSNENRESKCNRIQNETYNCLIEYLKTNQSK